jgi:predicted PurR-regulated permease PerM
MPVTPTPETTHVQNRSLLLLVAVITLAFCYIMLPFYGAVMWGAVLALLFAPLQRLLLLRFRLKPTLAAVVTMLVMIFIVVIPLAFISASLAREATLFYQLLESGELKATLHLRETFNMLPPWSRTLLDYLGLTSFSTIQRRLLTALSLGGPFAAMQAVSAGQNAFEFFISVSISLYLAFFLIRDGAQIVGTMRAAIPLAPGHKTALFEQFTTVIRATVKGNFLVATMQGALGGLIFFVLGVSGAMLLAVLMAFLSLLPAFGASLVWLPVAIYFLMTGALVKGMVLVAYGVLVIGLADNVLRPILVGRDTRMPDYLVMISTLGGMAVFGLNGFILGPAIAAMFIAVWRLHLISPPLVSYRTDKDSTSS